MKNTTMPMVSARKSGATSSVVSVDMAIFLFLDPPWHARPVRTDVQVRYCLLHDVSLYRTRRACAIIPIALRDGTCGQIMERLEKDFSTEAVRAELGRILKSPQFDASERNRGFLTFVVEEALGGRADRIKAYTIATEVFGRELSFDPQLDFIVRIEAGRLRRSLERYYLTDGRDSRLRIEIPRGGYLPVFDAAATSAGPCA